MKISFRQFREDYLHDSGDLRLLLDTLDYLEYEFQIFTELKYPRVVSIALAIGRLLEIETRVMLSIINHPVVVDFDCSDKRVTNLRSLFQLINNHSMKTPLFRPLDGQATIE